jgi:hypothetical protein
MKTTTTTAAEREALRDGARKLMPEGSTIYTIVRKRTANRCEVGLVVFRPLGDGLPTDFHPDYVVAALTGRKQSKDTGAVIFNGAYPVQLIHELSRALYGRDLALVAREL